MVGQDKAEDRSGVARSGCALDRETGLHAITVICNISRHRKCDEHRTASLQLQSNINSSMAELARLFDGIEPGSDSEPGLNTVTSAVLSSHAMNQASISSLTHSLTHAIVTRRLSQLTCSVRRVTCSVSYIISCMIHCIIIMYYT